MKYVIGTLTVAILLCSQKSIAETIPAYEMNAITVTANRTVTSVDETVTFEVIDREKIEGGNYKSVSEVLRTIPGIYFASESYIGNLSTESNTGPKIRIRGQGAKLLIDGRPMNMAIYGCLTNNMLTLDYIDRIEVTKGSESVLYGSDGLGGVINIITRDPEKLGGGLSIKGGSQSTLFSTLEHENTIGPFGYFLSGSFKRSDGYRGDSNFTDDSGFFKLKYDINQSLKLESSLNMYNGKWNDPGTIYNPQNDYWADLKRRQSDITLRGWDETSNYSIKLFHNEGHHIFTDQDGWHSRDNTNGYQADFTKNFSGGRNRLIIGSDGRWIAGKALVDSDLYNSNGFNFWLNNDEWYRENEVALFASDHHVFMEGKFALTGGARIVRNSAFGTFLCPKAGIAMNNENSSVHFGYNRGFKSPPLLKTNLHKKSNPDLNPEIADSYEIGGDYSLTKSLSLGGTVFYIDGKDRADMAYVNGVPQMFENIGKWRHKGGEITFDWMPVSRFAFRAGYTHMDVGANTQYNPEHQATMNVMTGWTILGHELSINLNGLGISKIYASNDSKNRLADYVLLDLYADWQVHKYGSIVIGADNLLDKNYESVDGYPSSGRMITAGIRLGK